MPGTPVVPGVAPTGVLMPILRCAMFSCACLIASGSPACTACTTRLDAQDFQASATAKHACSLPHLEPLKLVLQLGEVWEEVALDDGLYALHILIFLQHLMMPACGPGSRREHEGWLP